MGHRRKSIAFVHILSENLGDRVCCPMAYFDWSAFDIVEVDIRAPYSAWGGPHDIVICGGGGLLCDGQMHVLAQSALAAMRDGSKLVWWGAGDNRLHDTRIGWPFWLKWFDLVGCRDVSSPFQWVPCVSCMAKEFDVFGGFQPASPTSHYEHAQRPMYSDELLPDEPAGMDNEAGSLASALLHMAFGKTVITNTYHGAYWALLLGRRVFLTEAWATRFLDMPFGIRAGQFRRNTRALSICRAATSAFYKQVMELANR